MSTSDTDVNRNLDEERRQYAQQREVEEGEPRVIEQNIDATRADMRATLEALERRFSVDRLIDLTVGRIRERGGEFAGNLTEAATRNPVPLLLTSVGVAWMMLTSRQASNGGSSTHWSTSTSGQRMAGSRERAAQAADKVDGAVGSARDTLKSAMDSSGAALRDAAHASRETYEHAAEQLRSGATAAREQIDHARERMDRLLNEQPLLLGALGLAAGALIGALLPTTEHEDRFLGETRDKAVKTVAKASRERFEAVREHVAPHSAQAGQPAEAGSEERPAARPH